MSCHQILVVIENKINYANQGGDSDDKEMTTSDEQDNPQIKDSTNNEKIEDLKKHSVLIVKNEIMHNFEQKSIKANTIVHLSDENEKEAYASQHSESFVIVKKQNDKNNVNDKKNINVKNKRNGMQRVNKSSNDLQSLEQEEKQQEEKQKYQQKHKSQCFSLENNTSQSNKNKLNKDISPKRIVDYNCPKKDCRLQMSNEN